MKNRRKQLVEQYKQMKPDMGIYVVRNMNNQRCWLDVTQDLKSRMNRTRFQLEAGMHPVSELQKDWQELGADRFEFEILEVLKYDKDESKTDYSEELEMLKILWQEKLAKESVPMYQVAI